MTRMTPATGPMRAAPTRFFSGATMIAVAIALAAAATILAGAPAYAQAGDPLAGELAFRARCSGCHTASEDGGNRTGPRLFGAFGATAGQRDIGYRYSGALASSGIVWNEETLDQWLTSPRSLVPGNRMSFGGMGDPIDRANVIAFLRERTDVDLGTVAPAPIAPPATPAPPPAIQAPPPAASTPSPGGDQVAAAGDGRILLFVADMSQTQTVPSASSVPGAGGAGVVLLNTATNQISWLFDFTGLSGPVTGVHFHGPADRGETADVLLDIGAASGLTGPLAGRAMLNAEQARLLATGRWYINIHTELNPPGELRGQLER